MEPSLSCAVTFSFCDESLAAVDPLAAEVALPVWAPLAAGVELTEAVPNDLVGVIAMVFEGSSFLFLPFLPFLPFFFFFFFSFLRL